MINASSSSTNRLTKAFDMLGILCGWLLLALVVIQFGVVIGRYIFGVNFLWAQELTLYLHSGVFMLGAGWTLLKNRHVRIDVFNNQLSKTGRVAVERIGLFLFLIPSMLIIFVYSIGYAYESWSILEGSREVSGLPGVFLLKSLIPMLAAIMLLAGVIRWMSRDE